MQDIKNKPIIYKKKITEKSTPTIQFVLKSSKRKLWHDKLLINRA